MAAFHQSPDHFDHARNVNIRRGLGKLPVTAHAQRGQILKEGLLERLGELRQRHTLRAATADGLVIHIGQIHHPLNFEPPEFQMPLQQVFKNVSAEIADVGVIVDCRPAGVHAHAAGFEGLEILDLAGQGIKETKGHAGGTVKERSG